MQIQKPKQGYKLVNSTFGKNEIPEEWNYSTFKEVLELIIDHRGITPKKLGGNWSEKGISTISAMNINSGKLVRPEEIRYVDLQMYEKWMPEKLLIGDVILTSEAPLGEAYYVENPNFCLSQRLFGLRSRKSLLDSKFLYYFLISEVGQDELHKRSTGTTVKGIRQAELVKISILLPPLNEQQRITSILSNVDLLIQQTQKEIEQTQSLKKGLMQKLLTKGIGHIRFKEAKLYPKYLSAEIPEDWKVVSLYDVVQKIADRDHTTPTYVKEGIMIISPTNLDDEMDLDLKNVKFISKQEHEKNYKKTDIRPNDIIFSRIGAVLGKSYLVKKDFYNFSILHSLCQIRTNEKILPDFLLWFLRSNLIQKRIWVTVQSIGVPDLGLQAIGNLPIFLPPLTEQQKIASILSNIDSQIKKQQEYKLYLENLRKSLMQKLLTGQIRIKT